MRQHVAGIVMAMTGALALAPAAARAQSVGTIFSGPVEADGASAWTNPATMSAGEGTLTIDGNSGRCR